MTAPAPPTLLDLLDSSRVFALRQAIVATLRPLFPGCEVKSHPGRLDMEDVAGEHAISFATPSLNVGVVRILAAEGRMSGYHDVPVEVGIYVVTADQAVAPRGLVTRDEIGLALCEGVLAVVEDPDRSRWGLADIAPPEDAAATPLFTALSNKAGTTFYAVTWRQMIFTLGHPFTDFETSVAAGFAPPVHLPGDPLWTPPPAGGAP